MSLKSEMAKNNKREVYNTDRYHVRSVFKLTGKDSFSSSVISIGAESQGRQSHKSSRNTEASRCALLRAFQGQAKSKTLRPTSPSHIETIYLYFHAIPLFILTL